MGYQDEAMKKEIEVKSSQWEGAMIKDLKLGKAITIPVLRVTYDRLPFRLQMLSA